MSPSMSKMDVLRILWPFKTRPLVEWSWAEEINQNHAE